MINNYLTKHETITHGIKQSGFSAILGLCIPFKLRWRLTVYRSQSASISYRQMLNKTLVLLDITRPEYCLADKQSQFV